MASGGFSTSQRLWNDQQSVLLRLVGFLCGLGLCLGFLCLLGLRLGGLRSGLVGGNRPLLQLDTYLIGRT